jgi:hypothetical protein
VRPPQRHIVAGLITWHSRIDRDESELTSGIESKIKQKTVFNELSNTGKTLSVT